MDLNAAAYSDGEHQFSSSSSGGAGEVVDDQEWNDPPPPPLLPPPPPPAALPPPPPPRQPTLSITNVVEIMRRALPPRTMISKDAKETMIASANEFISFFTQEANQRCLRENRKTLTAEDVLWALNQMGLENYAQVLTHYLNHYRRRNDINAFHAAGPSGFGGQPQPADHDDAADEPSDAESVAAGQATNDAVVNNNDA